MKFSIINRSIVAGHNTGASFEDALWDDLRQIAKCDESSSHSTTNVDRQHANLSASRLCVLGLLPRSRAH